MTENAEAVATEANAGGDAAPNPLERRVEMTVSMAQIDVEVGQRLRQMSRTVKMPGFRPGEGASGLWCRCWRASARRCCSAS